MNDLISDWVITETGFYAATVSEVPPVGREGRQYHIALNQPQEHAIIEKDVFFSRRAIATLNLPADELAIRLLQLREALPAEITSSNLDAFKLPQLSRVNLLRTTGKLLMAYFASESDRALEPRYLRNSLPVSLDVAYSLLEFYVDAGALRYFEIGSTAVTKEKNWLNRLRAALSNLEELAGSTATDERSQHADVSPPPTHHVTVSTAVIPVEFQLL